MTGLTLIALIAAAGCSWTKRAESLAAQCEASYQATLRSYSQALRLGSTRKDVESYLRSTNKSFRQMCCMEGSGKNAWDDLTSSEHNVYIGFEFVSAGTHSLPVSPADELDTLTKIRIFYWLEGCL